MASRSREYSWPSPFSDGYKEYCIYKKYDGSRISSCIFNSYFPFLLDNRSLLSFRFLVSVDESWSLSQQGSIIFSFYVIVSEASLWSLSDLWDIRRSVSRASGKDFTSNKKEGLFLPYSLFSYFGNFQISRATELLITMWWWAWWWHSIPWRG